MPCSMSNRRGPAARLLAGPVNLGWLLMAIVLSGCHTTARPYPPLSLPASARLVEVANGSSANDSHQTQPDSGTRGASFKPRNVLVLSGGGANGAYTAGVLNGWLSAGTRPEFDVVTGISVGG